MKKTVLVTGSTGAIGRATSVELAKNDCQLILFGRSAEKLENVKSVIKATTGNNDIDVILGDLSEPESIRHGVAEIRKKYSSLKALVNIAAIFKSSWSENSFGAEYMFATNHLGPFVLTNDLLDLLKSGKPSRVVTVSAPSTSKINFDDITGKNKFSSGFLSTFGATKMMNIMFSYALARRLEGTGVNASVFHPGLVRSGLTDEMPPLMNYIFKRISRDPEKASKMLCNLAIGSQFENSNGKFYKFDGSEIKSNNYSLNTELQEKLWTITEQISHTINVNA